MKFTSNSIAKDACSEELETASLETLYCANIMAFNSEY